MILMMYILLIQYSNSKINVKKIKLIFGLKKFTLKSENVKYLTNPPQFVLQDKKNLLKGLIELHLPHYEIP